MKKQTTSKISQNDLLGINDKKSSYAFEEMVINTDFVRVVKKLMTDREMSRPKLAEELNVSEAYISKLFSSDKKFNVSLLAKLQRIFNTRFKVVTSGMVKQLENEIVEKQNIINEVNERLLSTQMYSLSFHNQFDRIGTILDFEQPEDIKCEFKTFMVK